MDYVKLRISKFRGTGNCNPASPQYFNLANFHELVVLYFHVYIISDQETSSAFVVHGRNNLHRTAVKGIITNLVT